MGFAEDRNCTTIGIEIEQNPTSRLLLILVCRPSLMTANNVNQEQISDLMRRDLQKSLNQSHIDPAALSTFQRILLTTDGTLTEILEAYLFEHIYVVKLSENIAKTTEAILPLELETDREIIDRKILLQGKISRQNFIYAESIIVLNRLEEKLKEGLLKSQIPMGRLWLENKLETFKEIVISGKERAGDLSDYFNIGPDDRMLFRTYRVFSNRQPIIMITEKFPESYFLKDF